MVDFTEDLVGKPVLGTNTIVVGTVTDVSENALVVEQEPGTSIEQAGAALLSSGDGQYAVVSGQVEKVTEDGVYLADPSEVIAYDDVEVVDRTESDES